MPGSRYFGPLSQLLELPCFPNLHNLLLCCGNKFHNNYGVAIEGQLGILSHIEYTQGAPYLQDAGLTFFPLEPDFGPLAARLREARISSA